MITEFLKIFADPVDAGMMYFGITCSILVPVIAGIILFCLTDRFKLLKGITALIISALSIFFTLFLYTTHTGTATLAEILGNSGDNGQGGILYGASEFITFSSDSLSKLIIVCISIFSFLMLLYSLAYKKKDRVKNYYSFMLITLGCSTGAVLSDNLLVFLFFWGVLGITLYLLIHGDDEQSSAAAKKTLILIGASDSIMIIGIGILWKITGTVNMSEISVPTSGGLAIVSFIALLIGSFTKAGAFPFHTWVPDYSREAPASSTAFLPASLDKLLGIYFLARITCNIFTLSDIMQLVLLITGVVTIITAVMMALVQHNYKKLLGFHAVSQVGYMIVGFGLGSMIGVAAGLFHMLNNAIYKSGLFLAAGSVEQRTGMDNIDDLGGLSRAMPFTFFASLVFAMSISGVPPFNGFASKWMIYQGIIEFGNGQGIASQLWVIWLGLAVFGSALTLASFIKFVGGIFLGRKKEELMEIREVHPVMWIPQVILALLCIVLGIFATRFVVRSLFMPVTGTFEFTGFWDSTLVSALVLVSIIIGIIIYLSTAMKRFRTDDSFIGGEDLRELTSYPTPEFYKTVGEFRLISWFYRKAEKKWFDLYDLSRRLVFWLGKMFSDAHNGVLTGYILWVFAGLIIMLLIMI